VSNKLTFSFEPKANGDWGVAFAIGACVIGRSGEVVASCAVRCRITGQTDPRVAEEVLPALGSLPRTHESYGSMLGAFHRFYVRWGRRDDVDVIAPVAFPVASTVLRDMLRPPSARDADERFSLLDVATALRLGEHDPGDVERYNREHAITVPFDESPQHPLYGAAAAALCWRDLLIGRPRGPRRHRLEGTTIELGTGNQRFAVTVVGWYRTARGHRITDESDPAYRAAADAYLRSRRATGWEVLCIGPGGEPLVFHSTDLAERSRGRTGDDLARRRASDG
jgi:hypothetical protein